MLRPLEAYTVFIAVAKYAPVALTKGVQLAILAD